VTALERFLGRFDSPIKDGRGWRVRCPAHDDNDPSLHVEQSQDGSKVLVVCRAGCSLEQILHKLGATSADLFESHSENGKEGPTAQGRPPFGRVVKTYDYLNEQNVLVYQVLRDEHKNFRQRRPTNSDPGIGEPWTYNLDGVRRVLYRLPEVEAANKLGHRIYVVEGEKDADNLASIGLTATTAAQGASSPWLPTYTEQLAGAVDVVIIPDNDKAGREHALAVRDAIAPHVQTVRVLELPGLADKGDVSNWLETGGGNRDELERLANDAAPYVLPVQRFSSVAFSAPDFIARQYPAPPSLLGDGILCAGDLAILYGKPGTAKTWAALQLAIAVARAEPWFGIPTGNAPLRVGVLELEVHAVPLQARLRALGVGPGDSGLRIVSRPDLNGRVDLREDLDFKALESWCRDDGLGLLVVDALSRVHNIDENQAKEMAPLLGRFDDLRFATRTAPLLIHHEPKGPSKGRDAVEDIDALRGSSRLSSDPNCLIRLIKLPSGLRTLRFVKTNNAADTAPLFLLRTAAGPLELTDAPENQAKKGAATRDRVLVELRKHPGGAKTGAIADAVGLEKNTARGHLCKLEEGGKAHRVGDSKATTWFPVDLPTEEAAQ